MSEAIVYRVPGRINFIGEHTDYNLGFVLPGAIDLGLTFRMKKATGVHTEIRSLLYGETARCDALGRGLNQPWTIFFRRTLELLRSRGYQIGPVICEFGGDLPSGAGLSSSSAITCGFIHGLNHLFELGLSQMDIVQVASEAERGSGVEGGQMDQYAITFGEKGSLLYLDCRSMTHESVNTDLGDYQLVLWNTKVEHSLIDSGYNDRHHDCRRGLHMLQAKDGNINSIRDISLERLQSMKSELDPVSYQRILYVLQENDRVEATVAALKANDLEVAGELLYESHHGLATKYEVSCQELDYLVNWSKQYPKVLGARMMGGGFGGCVVALVRGVAVDDLFHRMASDYEEQFGLVPELHRVSLEDGIRNIG